MAKPRFTWFAGLASILLTSSVWAGPTVVPTSEGQIGEVPGDDRVIGQRLESIRGQAGDVLSGGLTIVGGAVPPPPEFQFITDRIHNTPNPQQVSSTPGDFNVVTGLVPASGSSRNATDDGDFVAFSFAVDGSMPNTMSVRIATFDETGSSLVDVPIDNIPTFPDPAFHDTGIAVDNQGRVTVAYTELATPMGPVRVQAQRFDAQTGQSLDMATIGDDRISPNVALLDPAGNRLIVPTTDFQAIIGNIVDTAGPTPVVLPDFPISTTPGIANALPQVAAYPSTGAFTVVWENIVDLPGDPVNVRARRFDAMGNPVGDDFIVNTTTANAQGQPTVAYGPNGEVAVAWVGDGMAPADDLDVFLQVYDPMGNPIGGETRVNSVTEQVQDKPGVRFLPEPDSLGQPQLVVNWRDVGNADGSLPRGTGNSYRCFSIGEDPTAIFADGFESGDTSSWSDSNP